MPATSNTKTGNSCRTAGLRIGSLGSKERQLRINWGNQPMCAICGLMNFNSSEPVDSQAVEKMTTSMEHRGPDDHGYFVNGNVGLGHRRLSIIDLSGGKQPIYNEDGSAVIVFNGEIYNYR